MAYDWDGLADAIRVERARRRLSQAQLADEAGVSQGTIKNLEGGHSYKKPPAAALLGIDRAFKWGAGTAEGIVRGTANAPEDVESVAPEAPSLPPLKDRLPDRVHYELENGKIWDAEVYDLTQGGGLRMIQVIIRKPEDTRPLDHEQLRREWRDWERKKRVALGEPPLAWEPGDPAEEGASEA